MRKLEAAQKECVSAGGGGLVVNQKEACAVARGGPSLGKSEVCVSARLGTGPLHPALAYLVRRSLKSLDPLDHPPWCGEGFAGVQLSQDGEWVNDRMSKHKLKILSRPGDP